MSRVTGFELLTLRHGLRNTCVTAAIMLGRELATLRNTQLSICQAIFNPMPVSAVNARFMSTTALGACVLMRVRVDRHGVVYVLVCTRVLFGLLGCLSTCLIALLYWCLSVEQWCLHTRGCVHVCRRVRMVFLVHC